MSVPGNIPASSTVLKQENTLPLPSQVPTVQNPPSTATNTYEQPTQQIRPDPAHLLKQAGLPDPTHSKAHTAQQAWPPSPSLSATAASATERAILNTTRAALCAIYPHSVPGAVTTITEVEDVDSDVAFRCQWYNETGLKVCDMGRSLHYKIDETTGKPTVSMHITCVFVDASHRGKGMCAAILGDEIDVLKKIVGPDHDIIVTLEASGVGKEKDGRVFWGKLGAEFKNNESREGFLACCRTWVDTVANPPMTHDLKTELIKQLDNGYKDIETDKLMITAPWILFRSITSLKPMGAELMTSLAQYLSTAEGAAWNAIIRVRPGPENTHTTEVFRDRVALARAQRAQAFEGVSACPWTAEEVLANALQVSTDRETIINAAEGLYAMDPEIWTHEVMLQTAMRQRPESVARKVSRLIEKGIERLDD